MDGRETKREGREMNNSRGFNSEAWFLGCVFIMLLLFAQSPSVFAQDSGEKLFKWKCAQCHSLDGALNRIDPAESWEKVVARKRSEVPWLIKAEEAKAITAYLENRDKVVSSGRPALRATSWIFDIIYFREPRELGMTRQISLVILLSIYRYIPITFFFIMYHSPF